MPIVTEPIIGGTSGGGGSGTVTSVNVAATGYSSSGAVTGSGTVTLTRNAADVLPENTSIGLDAALSADGKYSGVTIGGTAGAALAFGELCYFNSSSKWVLADADAASTAGDVKLGFCVLAAAADNDPTTILLFGNIRADAKFPTFTVGVPVYAHTTAGEVTATKPSGTDDVIRRVGFALTADSIFVDISPDFITAV